MHLVLMVHMVHLVITACGSMWTNSLGLAWATQLESILKNKNRKKQQKGIICRCVFQFPKMTERQLFPVLILIFDYGFHSHRFALCLSMQPVFVGVSYMIDVNIYSLVVKCNVCNHSVLDFVCGLNFQARQKSLINK